MIFFLFILFGEKPDVCEEHVTNVNPEIEQSHWIAFHQRGQIPGYIDQSSFPFTGNCRLIQLLQICTALPMLAAADCLPISQRPRTQPFYHPWIYYLPNYLR